MQANERKTERENERKKEKEGKREREKKERKRLTSMSMASESFPANVFIASRIDL